MKVFPTESTLGEVRGRHISLHGTVTTALEQSYDELNQQVDECIVQKAESVFTTIPETVIGLVDLGYRVVLQGGKH